MRYHQLTFAAGPERAWRLVVLTTNMASSIAPSRFRPLHASSEGPRALAGLPHPSRRPLLARPAAAAGDDAEVAVFRFTLGSDAADALVPRVVGGVGAAALVVNHLLGGEPSEAQVRACAVGKQLAWVGRCSAAGIPAARCTGGSPLICVAVLCCNLASWTPCLVLQMRAEVLGVALAAVAVATPAVEQRLKELTPGRGRQAAASSVPGATSVFSLQPDLPEATKQVQRPRVPRGWV